MFFDHHQKEPVIVNALRAMMEDMFIVAWYANWRKWPLVYKEWSWADRKCEVQNPLKALIHQATLKRNIWRVSVKERQK